MEIKVIRSISSNGTDVDHSVTELDKGAPSGREWVSSTQPKDSTNVPMPRRPHRLIGRSKSAM